MEPSLQPARRGLGQGRACPGQRQVAAVRRSLAAAWSCGSRVTRLQAAQRRDGFSLPAAPQQVAEAGLSLCSCRMGLLPQERLWAARVDVFLCQAAQALDTFLPRW